MGGSDKGREGRERKGRGNGVERSVYVRVGVVITQGWERWSHGKQAY